MRAEEGMHSGSLMADPDLVRSRKSDWLQSPASIRDELSKISTLTTSASCRVMSVTDGTVGLSLYWPGKDTTLLRPGQITRRDTKCRKAR